MAGRGYSLIFHGGFGTKAKAKRKEEARPGSFILKRKVKGHPRYLVVSENGGSTFLRMK